MARGIGFAEERGGLFLVEKEGVDAAGKGENDGGVGGGEYAGIPGDAAVGGGCDIQDFLNDGEGRVRDGAVAGGGKHVADGGLPDVVCIKESVRSERAGDDVLTVRIDKDERLTGVGVGDCGDAFGCHSFRLQDGALSNADGIVAERADECHVIGFKQAGGGDGDVGGGAAGDAGDFLETVTSWPGVRE